MNAIKQFNESLQSKPDITRDAYEMWQDNEVTKRLMADLTEDLMSIYMADVSSNPDYMIKLGYERSKAIEILEGILEWKPLEEIDDRDKR